MAFMQNKAFRIFALVLALVLGFGGVNYARYSGMQKIESTEDKFSMYVPEGWTVEYADPSPTVDVSGAFAYDNTKENFIFIIVSPAQTMDFQSDLQAWQKQFEAINFKFLSSEIKKHKGLEVAMYDASISNGSTPYYQKGFLTYANGNKYMVLAQCKDENKDELVKTFDKCFNSFKLEKE